jgi:hypothetical protein
MKTFDFEGVSYGVRPRTKYQRDSIAPSLHAIILKALGYDLDNLADSLNPIGWMMVTQFTSALLTVTTDKRPNWLIDIDAPLPKIMAAYEAWKAWGDLLPEWIDAWQAALNEAEGGAPDPKADGS